MLISAVEPVVKSDGQRNNGGAVNSRWQKWRAQIRLALPRVSGGSDWI
jgi:hypothetical protein